MKVFGDLAVTAGISVEEDELIKEFTKPDKRAHFVIQVNNVHTGKNQLMRVSFQVFRKSGRSFGKADQLLPWCAKNGCLGIIPDSVELSDVEIDDLQKKGIYKKPTQWPLHLQARVGDAMNAITLCPLCKTMTRRHVLPDHSLYQDTAEVLAKVLHKIWRLLKGDADVYLVRTRETKSTMESTAIAAAGQVHQDVRHYKSLLAKARDKEQVWYKLSRILDDVGSGKSLDLAFKHFLEA